MKRVLFILAAITILITSSACGVKQNDVAPEKSTTPSAAETSVQETTEEANVTTTEQSIPDTLSAEEAIEIFMSEKSKWEFKEMEEFAGFYYYFLDLDFDGICELITSNHAGSGSYSYNKYYKLDTENKTVTVLESDEEEYGGYDLCAENGIMLLRNKADGTMKYYMYDFLREGFEYNHTLYNTVELKESTITSTDIFVEEENTTYDGDSTTTYFVFEKGKKAEVSYDEYHSLKDKFFNENENLQLKYVQLDAKEIAEADSEDQARLMLYGYNGFYYTK